MGTQSLLLNIIPFAVPVKEMEFAFYTKKQDGFVPIHKDDLGELLEGKVKEDELHFGQWLYTNFAEAKPNAIILKVDLTSYPHFASHYYRHIIRNYFKGVADIMGSNYTNEVEVLIKNANSDSTKYRVYHQSTLKVQYARVTDGPELVLSFDGKTKEYAKSIQEMRNFDTDNLNWVNCDGELHKYKFMSAHFKLKMDKLFPMLSNKLKPELGINFDLPDFSNRYPKYQKLLQGFYDKLEAPNKLTT